ncbi:hypothetical protein STEG23_006949, partial [Scotinomys teguina]
MALDPAKQHLRHVEKDVLIPKVMREKVRERCSEQVEDFTRCCKDSGILMVVKCWKENSALKDCPTTAYYNDPAFYEERKLEYLKEREEFRKTRVPTKKRMQRLPTSIKDVHSSNLIYEHIRQLSTFEKLLLDGRMDLKMWYLFTMEYVSAEKNNDIMKFADKWIELENIILSE